MDKCYKLNEVIGIGGQITLFGTTKNIGLYIQLTGSSPIDIQLEIGTICIPQNNQVQQMVINSNKIISLSENNKKVYIEAYCVNLHLRPPKEDDFFISTNDENPKVSKILSVSEFLIIEHVESNKFKDRREKDLLFNEFYPKYIDTLQQTIWFITDGLDSEKSFNKFIWPKYEESFRILNNWILSNKQKWDEIGLLIKKINELFTNDTFLNRLKRGFTDRYKERIRLLDIIKKMCPDIIENYFIEEYLLNYPSNWYENPLKYIDDLYNSKFNHDVVRLLEKAGLKDDFGSLRSK